MGIGYACLALGVPGTDIRDCLIKNASETRLRELISHNLSSLERMMDYNIRNGIRLYRISSDIIPFASSPVNAVPWTEEYAERLFIIGRKIMDSGMRVSMHPGQYTVLNSPNEKTADSTVMELEYHARFLDSLGLDRTHRIILHIGGVYGDKKTAKDRFCDRFLSLDDAVRSRLVIENDDKCYHVRDALDISLKCRIPVVYDNLHHQANPTPDKGSESDWIAECAKTWQAEDGIQKIHYSQGSAAKKTGAHSLSVRTAAFLEFYESLGEGKPDIMLEVKDKNISAVKCSLCTDTSHNIGALEKEWGRYKYLVLERSQRTYRQIRELLKDKAGYPAVEMFRLIESALSLPPERGSAANAAAHVWGYVKDAVTARQGEGFRQSLNNYMDGKTGLDPVKRRLYAMALEQRQDYLLDSYYFIPEYVLEKE